MSKVKTVVVSIAVYLFLGVMVSLFVYYYTLDIGKVNAINGGITATAEIKYIEPYMQDEGYDTIYNLRYEYISPDGVKYTEVIALGTINEEEAESYIGKKIEIYIDGKGNSIPVGKNINVNTQLILAIVFGILMVGYTIGLIIYCIKDHKWNIAHKKYLEEKAAREAQEQGSGESNIKELKNV